MKIKEVCIPSGIWEKVVRYVEVHHSDISGKEDDFENLQGVLDYLRKKKNGRASFCVCGHMKTFHRKWTPKHGHCCHICEHEWKRCSGFYPRVMWPASAEVTG